MPCRSTAVRTTPAPQAGASLATPLGLAALLARAALLAPFSRRLRSLAKRFGVLLVAGSLFAPWPANARAQAPTAASIQQLIEQMGAPEFRRREEASARLQAIGEPAFGALAAAAEHPSREVRARAAALLRSALHRALVPEFEALGRLPDDKIDVELGMCLIARILNPRVERADLIRRLDELARQARLRFGPGVDPAKLPPAQALETLRVFLYEELKFAGDEQDYADPRNSSLESVLARRKGLPILLSHVMLAVGRRLGLPLEGVPLPGRYMVRYDGRRAPAGEPQEDLVFDAFSGRLLTPARLEQEFGRLPPEALRETSTNREVLVRMLNNLETHLYLRGRNDLGELVVACKLALQPAGAGEP